MQTVWICRQFYIVQKYKKKLESTNMPGHIGTFGFLLHFLVRGTVVKHFVTHTLPKRNKVSIENTLDLSCSG